MHCREVEERIEAWLDGELPPEEARRMADHLAACTACAAAVGWAETVRDGLRGLPQRDAPPALVARIKAAARERGAGGGARLVRGPWRPGGKRLIAASLLLAATLALALGLAYRLGPAAPAGRPVAGPPHPAGLGPAATAEIERADKEVRVALALIERFTRRAGDRVERELADAAVASATVRGLHEALAPLAPLGGRPVEGRRDGGPPSA